MKQLYPYALAILTVCGILGRADAVQYEPPINIVFMVHCENLLPDTSNYRIRIECLNWLKQEALNRPDPFKMTILMNGDFCEYAVLQGDQPLFEQLEADGHELGTHAHPIIRVGPMNWIGMEAYTSRYGIPNYNFTLTQQIWSDAKTWVDQLSTSNHSACVMPFLCSDEGQLITEFSFTSDPGNRSEKGLDYFGHLVRHPFRPGSDDRLGHELEENLSSPFVYIDHYAQIGNPSAHGYNCTEAALEQAFIGCYQEWLSQEMVQGDSLDYKVWTFGFLTHDWLFNQYYADQITLFLDFLEANYIGQYTPRGNLIARYATNNMAVTEYEDWESTHPGQSSFSYVHPYPQIPLVNEAMIFPADSTIASEWIEIYNPTDRGINVSYYKISSGCMWAQPPSYWRIPQQSWLGAHEYLIAANNGAAFRARYGFRPDFEVSGNTGARLLVNQGGYTLHNDIDDCCIINNEPPTPNTNTSITDGLSWGQDYVAGFTLAPPPAGVTYGRDANSTDTGYGSDWSINGNANAPTPGGANSNAFFNPEMFIRVDPAWVPMQVSPGGGLIRFNVKLGNELGTVQSVDLWIDMIYPNGSPSGTLILRENRNLAPQDSHTVAAQMNIPGSYNPGSYRLNIHMGDYPVSNYDMSYFYFQKLNGEQIAGNGNEEVEITWLDDERSDWVQKPVTAEAFELKGVSPNPFNPTATILFTLPEPSLVTLTVYDVQGRVVSSQPDLIRQAGLHQITFDGSNLPSGIYLYRLEAGQYTASGKMVLLK